MSVSELGVRTFFIDGIGWVVPLSQAFHFVREISLSIDDKDRSAIESIHEEYLSRQSVTSINQATPTNSQVGNSNLVDARNALRWRELCELIDSDETVYTHLIDVINDAFNLGSGALERHIDQAIAGRRGDGHG